MALGVVARTLEPSEMRNLEQEFHKVRRRGGVCCILVVLFANCIMASCGGGGSNGFLGASLWSYGVNPFGAQFQILY